MSIDGQGFLFLSERSLSGSMTVSPGGINAYRLRTIFLGGKSGSLKGFVQSHLEWWFLPETIFCNEILRF